MQHNRQYGYEDKQINKILEKYRQRPNSHLHQNLFPDYSAVKYNNEHQNALAASQISWLDKMAEINEKVCDQTVYYGKDQNNVMKPANQMKFSFNQNYQTQVKQDEKKNFSKDSSRGEGQESLRDIYMKEFQKESEKIKEVQKARQQILNSIVQNKYATAGHNKQNEVRSTTKRNVTNDNSIKNQVKHSNKASFGLQSIELPKNIIVEKKKQANKQQEMNSLRYLQESLAKTKRISQKPEEQTEKIHITKKNYLQLNSSVKIQNINDSNISIKQFNQKEVIFSQILHSIFDKADKCKIGKLDKTNCSYESIEDVFKICFGSIFSRIKFKNLTMNKHQFAKIGMQIVKELQSQEFNAIIEKAIKLNEKREKESKIKEFYCQKCQNKISKVVSFSPEKSPYINRKQQSQEWKENYIKEQSPVRSQFSKHKSTQKQVLSKENVPQSSQYKNYKQEKVNREKQTKSNSKLKKSIQESKYNTNRQRKSSQRTKLIHPKKRRNISQSMIAEHKRSLQDLVILSQKMQNCLTISRKFAVQSNKRSHYSELNQIPSYQFLQ